MIPRTARRLETTLVSSRQALPRPARLYSTPSKSRSAPAVATVSMPPPLDMSFLPQQSTGDLSSFLSRPVPLTLIPTPEPPTSTIFDTWFSDSQSHEMVGIIDACLHNLYDVPRAQQIFTRLRSKAGSASISTRMYNNFISVYMEMTTKEPERKQHWLGEAWKLYLILEGETDGIQPSARTYAIMFDMLNKFQNEVQVHDAKFVLSKVVERNILVTDVVTSSYFTTPEASAEIAKMISSTAFALGFKNVLRELGHFSALAKGDQNKVPEARPVTAHRQDAPDEEFVPFNIATLRSYLNDVVEAKSVFESDNNARQEHLESSAYDLALKQLENRNKEFHKDTPRDANLQYWIWTWHTKMEARLKTIIKSAYNIKNSPRPSRMTEEEAETRQRLYVIDDILPCLATVSAEKLSLMTILEMIRVQGTGGVQNGMKATATLIAIGKTVENEYKAAICKQSKIPIVDYDIQRGNYFSVMGHKYLHQRRIAAARSQDLDERWQGDWSQAMRSKVGAFLVNTLESVATVTRRMVDPETGETISEEQPALFSAYEFVRGHKLGVLKFNEAVCERIAKDNVISTVHARHLPMLVKPKPWISTNQGGYIYNKTTVMRFKDSVEQESYLQKAALDGSMEHIFAGLDVLGSTPWRINREVFDVVLEVWNSGKRMGKIPPAVYEQPEPVLEPGKEQDIQEKTNHISRHKVWAQANANNHSDRCSVNYKIEIARTFLDDVIYMPHNLDFRGRAYPIPPHLSHIGDDLSRSLLLFAEGKKLGERGLRWLKIHAANLYGYDKANFEERVQWVDEHIDQIRESATDPLNGTGWWRKAGDPWQFLATTKELIKALELDDPTEYICAMPVHQDGTCNGLQHYAALGGDVVGAQQVNLLASDRPSDVYTHISTTVEKQLAEEAEAGNENAKMLMGKITRKVVKQTVMTTVYGVTFIGAREQIERQLKDRGDIPPELCWGASSYLTKKVLGSIGGAFTGAKGIQDWLTLCARLITKSVPLEKLDTSASAQDRQANTMKEVKKMQMTSVIWTTKLGLPIVQPYRRIVRKQIRTSMQSLYISDPRILSEVNSVKQASAFPPNFVHSLDATHMMLTALKCREHGLAFASVHDSYWTHACDVDEMSEIIRDTFIMLHSSDILGALEKEFRDRYKNHYVALQHLAGQNTKFIMKLRDAGCRIYARREQEAELHAIRDLVTFTDDKSSIEVVENPEMTPAAEEEFVGLAGDSEGLQLLAGKFVRLTDLFPPLPKKGDLQVEDIKMSPYFFS